MKVYDLRNINWVKSPGFTGTPGCYMKAKVKCSDNKIHYYKLSNFNEQFGFIGVESINEVIAYRVGKILGFDVLEQKLKCVIVKVNGIDYKTYMCDSVNYKNDNETRISIGDYYRSKSNGNRNVCDVLVNCGLERYVNIITVFDYLIIGRDRHDSNMEVLFNSKNGKLRTSPIFDNGISLLAPITLDIPIRERENKIRDFKELDDYIGNNFIGTRSLSSNLYLINKPIYVNKLTKEHKRSIFYGLHDVLSESDINKIWSILCYRYSYLRKIGKIKER